MSFISRLRITFDATGVEKCLEGILSALQQTRPGAGISLKNPGSQITSHAVMRLLARHGDKYEVTDFGHEVTILRKIDMARSMSREWYDHETNRGSILNRDNYKRFMEDGGLPSHKFRAGVPDDFNDEPAQINGILVDSQGRPVETGISTQRAVDRRTSK